MESMEALPNHPLSRSEIEERVFSVLRQQCKVAKPLTLKSNLISDLGLDSVSMLSLLMEVENHYRIILGEDPDHPPQTIGDLVELVDAQLSSPAQSEDTQEIYTGNSLCEALFHAAQGKGGVHFYNRKREIFRLGYEDLYQRAGRLAYLLKESHGIMPGDVVVLIMGTSPQLVESIFGVLFAGAILCCLPGPRMGQTANYSKNLQSFLKHSCAKAVLTEDRLLPKLLKATINMPETKRPKLTAFSELEDALQGMSQKDQKPHLSHACQENTAALLQFSSGTTGTPKGVLLSHGNITSNCQAILQSLPKPLSQHSGASWLPLHHDMGLIGGLFSAVCAGGDMTFLRPEDFAMKPLLWLQMMSDTKATICPAPNFALQLLCDRVKSEEWSKIDLSHWEVALIGAEPVKTETLERFYKHAKASRFSYNAFTPVYGLAEATLAVSFSEIEKAPHCLCAHPQSLQMGHLKLDPNGIAISSVGKALEGIQIKIQGGDDTRLPDGQIGKILVKGPSVMQGYLVDGQLQKSTLPGGWLDTGDLGFIYKKNLYICGRSKDTIIINGRNIDPSWIEQSIGEAEGLEHKGVAAIPVYDDKKGTESFALLVEKKKGKLTEAKKICKQIADSIASHTGLSTAFVGILEFASMPRTTSGKIQRRALRKAFQEKNLKIHYFYSSQQSAPETKTGSDEFE